MEEIIKQYGRFFFSAAVFVLFLSLFFFNITDDAGNKGILKIIGAKFTVSDNKYEDYKDHDSYKKESQKALPTIRYAYAGNVYSGTDIKLSDLIEAKDYQNADLPMRVLRIKNSTGDEITGIYDAVSGKIRFPDQGIYKVAVTVTDQAKKKKTCTINIPVNKGA